MENIVKKYSEYTENVAETWKKRLTWQGLNGREPKHTTSIIKFNEETNAFASLAGINTANKFFEAVEKLAGDYTQWVSTKEHPYSEKEYNDMRNFFVGALGEMFFYHVFMDVKNLLVQTDNTNTHDIVYFSHVSPTLAKDKDYGVDFTAVANGVGCVMQVKFWNPFDTKTKMDAVTVAQKAFAEGVAHDLIEPKQNNTVVLCCLFDETTVYGKFASDSEWKRRVVVVGKDCLEKNINGETKKVFWDNFVGYLANLKTSC